QYPEPPSAPDTTLFRSRWHTVDDQFSQFVFEGCWCTEAGAFSGGFRNRVHHLIVTMPEDERPETEHIVDILIAVDIICPGVFGMIDECRITLYRMTCSDRTGPPARH